jgi:putative hemolysin
MFPMKIINEKDFESLSPLFSGIKGKRLTEFNMKFFAFDKVNQLYEHSSQYAGAEFASGILNEMGVNYLIGNPERLKKIPPDGAFITISNHPYGGLDGIILVDLFAALRPDYKLMVNKVLSLVKAMRDNFISVLPVTNDKTTLSGTNINGIRKTLLHVKNGHPIGFFPSGAVSDFNLKDFRLRDRQWQQNVLSLIKSVKVPIIPVRFFDRNSLLFYFLGLINWKIRLMRLPHEIFNKQNVKTRIGIGEIITVEDQQKYMDVKSFGSLLRKSVYEMPLPDYFIPRTLMEAASHSGTFKKLSFEAE